MKEQTSKNWRSILVSILWTKLTLEHWRAKLVSVVLAIMVWYLIRKNVETTTPSVSERPSSTPVTETR
jgi:sugar phosphate permease